MVLGVAIQNLSTLAKVVALVGLALAVFFLGDPSGGAFAGLTGEGAGSSILPTSWTGFGVALIAVLWAYDGWADATYIAGEVKDPERALPRALIGGFGLIVGVYLLLNGAYLFVLPLEAMAASELVAADAASAALGAVGASVVGALVLLSTFGALNGTMMSGPRVFFALGQDRLFFRQMGAVHPKGRTPHVAILTATVLGVCFVSVRTFEQLAESFILGLWPFFMLAVLAVFKLRRTRPELPRGYRTWGYPVVPALFLGVSTAMLLNALVAQPLSTLFSFGVIASGVPVFWWWVKGKKVGKVSGTGMGGASNP
jgi:amino acid transporter